MPYWLMTPYYFSVYMVNFSLYIHKYIDIHPIVNDAFSDLKVQYIYIINTKLSLWMGLPTNGLWVCTKCIVQYLMLPWQSAFVESPGSEPKLSCYSGWRALHCIQNTCLNDEAPNKARGSHESNTKGTIEFKPALSTFALRRLNKKFKNKIYQRAEKEGKMCFCQIQIKASLPFILWIPY